MAAVVGIRILILPGLKLWVEVLPLVVRQAGQGLAVAGQQVAAAVDHAEQSLFRPECLEVEALAVDQDLPVVLVEDAVEAGEQDDDFSQ